MQALFVFRADSELFRQMIDIFLQEMGYKIQLVQRFEFQPLKCMEPGSFPQGKGITSGKQIRIGNVH